MIALGLDIATRTGACYSDGAPVARSFEGAGAATVGAFALWLEEMMVRRRPDLLVLEGIVVAKSAGLGVNSKAWFMRGAAMAIAWRLGVPMIEIAPASLKKSATGSGRADKAAMIRAANWQGAALGAHQNDEADAFHLARAGLQLWRQSRALQDAIKTREARHG